MFIASPIPQPAIAAHPSFAYNDDELPTQLHIINLNSVNFQTYPIPGGEVHHVPSTYTSAATPLSHFIQTHSQQSSVSTASTETFRPSIDQERCNMKEGTSTKDASSSASVEGMNDSQIPVRAMLPTVLLSPSQEEESSLPRWLPTGHDQRISLQSLSLTDIENFDSLSDLDLRDDRGDPDSIVSKRLTRNELLRRISALSAGSSLWDSSQYDPIRASVQTYGSSVLTYGSRASQYLGEDLGGDSDGERERPSAPLPWVPRPSALGRIQEEAQQRGRARSGSGSSTSSRPLPPVPAPSSASSSRDRSVSAPTLSRSDSNSSASVYSVSSAGSVRRLPRPSPRSNPRPLPRTPASSTSSQLPDIAEGEVSSSRVNSMFLSPTEDSGSLEDKVRGGRQRYSTIGYGQLARSMMNARNVFEQSRSDGLSKKKGFHSRATSRTSTRTTRSVYFVPDVDELVQILNSMDDGSGSSPSSGSSAGSMPTTPIATQRLPSVLKEGPESRHVSRGKEDEDGDASVEITGLPTPAATPRSSPQRQPSNLPSHKDKNSSPVSVNDVSKPVTPADIPEPSPVPTSAGGLSLTNFPLPPPALRIAAPEAVGADDIPIPSASVGEPSPSFGKSFAEQATLPGMEIFLKSREQRTPSPPRHIRTQDAIADLKQRVSILPGTPSPPKKPMGKYGPVPLLSQPVPPRRRAQSHLASNAPSSEKKRGFSPRIDVKAANAFVEGNPKFNISNTVVAGSAPALGASFEDQKPTIIYSTPAPVAPLRIRRASNAPPAKGSTINVTVPPPSSGSQSASAMQTTFGAIGPSAPSPRPQRAASICVSPCSAAASTVAPLRLHKTRPGLLRSRSSTISGFNSSHSPTNKIEEEAEPLTSVEGDVSDDAESDQLKTPTNVETPETPLARIIDAQSNDAKSSFIGSRLTVGSTSSALQGLDGNSTLDPALADVIKSIAGASEEEQMGSLLTIASSIHTEHHASGYNAGFNFPFVLQNGEKEEDFVDVDEDSSSRKERVRKSVSSSVSERRRSKGRSLSSMKRRQSTRSAAAVRAAIRALPDPSTFPIPSSAGSTVSNSSAADGASDFTGFIRPSPLPKLKVVTKFKGGNAMLLPASQAPISAVSTKSSMSVASGHMGGHSRNSSSVGGDGRIVKRSSTVVGPRKMNRLTLTDPRSPMADATIAAAALVARVRQKRSALSQRGALPSASGRSTQAVGRAQGHSRSNSGSSGTLRSKLKMSGSGFFGSSVRSTTEHDTVMRSGPRAHRPTVRRTRAERDAAAMSQNGDVVLDLCS